MLETCVVLLILLPLIGVLVNTLFIRTGRLAGLVASAVMLIAFVVALYMFAVLLGRAPEARTVDFVLYQWIQTGPLQIPVGFLLDPLAMVMVLLITGVGLLIHIYSIGYMANDARPVRYFVYMNLFVSSMLLLVLANNYLLLYLGWEGVGLCSYLLIGHSFDRRDARDASLKAFIINRIGDVALLLMILAIYSKFGSIIFSQVFPRAIEVVAPQQVQFLGGPIGLATALGFLMLIAVAAKSAQIPLFVWLPDAMAGPTPASALIHAATMVTSGVYLIARNHAIFSLSLSIQHFGAYIGAITAFVAASIAIGQYDIKKVLAYSTVSQLGFMVAAVCLGGYVAGLFHLLTHGIFKALLFLAAGSVIHGTHERQDMRLMGGLRHAMPRTSLAFGAGVLAIAGIFPFAGFWSKDEILGYTWNTYPGPAVILMITAVLTAFYMGRQWFLVFWGEQRDHSYHPHESEPMMTLPLMILAFGALVAGVINLPFLGSGLSSFLSPVFVSETHVPTNWVLALLMLVLSLAALYITYLVYGRHIWRKTFRDPIQPWLGVFFEGFETAWGSDAYSQFFIRSYQSVARFLARVVEPLGIDWIVNGVGRAVGTSSDELRLGQSGYLRSYTMVFLVGAIAIIGYFGFVALR